MIRNSGIIVDWTGTIMVPKRRENITFLPRKRIVAKAKPASELVRI
jgi:hypothetical protein